MSTIRLNPSPDILQLRTAGYNIAIRRGYLLVRDVPYLNSGRAVLRGTFVCKLETAGDIITPANSDHTIKFMGELPYHADGSSMNDVLVAEAVTVQLDEGIETNFTFSRKPPALKYPNYFDKVETYVAYLLREASQVEPEVSALTHAVYEPEPEDQDYPFQYFDTASARAEINLVSKKLAEEKIAIVGLGGTGSYILDLVAKTPVREIHLFDEDIFLTHNAFRSPGAPSVEALREQQLKTVYFANVYSRMHRNIKAHEKCLDATTIELLQLMTFVFLAMDSGPHKQLVVERLEAWNVPFIDVGMGLSRFENALTGKVRVTASLPGRRESARENIPLSAGDAQAEYSTNIQIADLNALNACLAVIRWKKYRGFYLDSDHEQLTMYTIGQNLWTVEDLP